MLDGGSGSGKQIYITGVLSTNFSYRSGRAKLGKKL